MNIVEMRDKRAKLWATMEGFLDTHRSEKGVLSVDDDTTYNNMEKELNDLTNEIKRTERRDAIEAELAKPVGVPITEKPMKSGTDEKRGRASNAYKEDFGLHLRGKHLLHNVLSEGVDANGGYLVPEEFERQIVDALKEENVMRKLCKIITTANERKIPVAGTHSVAAWTAENAAYTESNPTFDQKTIDAYKLTDLIKVSIELLTTARSLWNHISRRSLPTPSASPRKRRSASAAVPGSLPAFLPRTAVLSVSRRPEQRLSPLTRSFPSSMR